VVLVATVRALKAHGGGPRVVPGRPLHHAYTEENMEWLHQGISNLVAHIGIARRFGVPVVVAVNLFPTDTPREIDTVIEAALEGRAAFAVASDHWRRGGEGAADLAAAVVEACELEGPGFRQLYTLEQPIKDKIETIATEIYGADSVTYTPLAERQIGSFEDSGYRDLPICMAKTHLSISHDRNLKGAPTGYSVPVREVRASAGAGFIYPILGDVRTMPGLGSAPALTQVDIDQEGEVVGLF
jgi:methylenetetrahydrofolate dehydrogenase (NADP+)/methenyltetrahydrofolate cyclohydrolase/formyltetrahydrofolate synthetase/formate--tetrahydrofolate ligase